MSETEKERKKEIEREMVEKEVEKQWTTPLFLYFSISLFLYLSSCSPYRFSLQKNTGWPIEGRILSSKQSVDVVDNNHLVIADDASVAMRCVELTDGIFDTEVKFDGAMNLLLRFRSTPFDDSVQHKHGFSIQLSEYKAVLKTDDTTITKPVLLPMNTPFRLIVHQLGEYFDVEVACTNVGRVRTTNPSTQWMIASVPGGGSVHFIDPRFSTIESEFEEETLRKQVE